MLAALALLVGPALAYTPAGYGVPEQGGALAGPSEGGAAGVFTNPAHAHADGGSWLVDVGWIYSALHYELDYEEGFSLTSRGAALVPSLAGAESIGPVGLGVALMPLLSRGGGDGAPEDGAQRFHTVRGGIQLLELDLAAAVQLHPAWTLGGAFRYGVVSMGSTRAIDAGVLIESLAGPDSGAPIGDPFLEGTQILDDHQGGGIGGSFGLRFEPRRGPGLSLAWRTPMVATVQGPVSVVPSDYLEIELQAEATTQLVIPPMAILGLDIPVGGLRLCPEASWIGWSSYYSFESELDELELGSDSDAVHELLDAYGLTKAEFLESASQAISTTGMHDVFNLGLSAWVPLGEQLDTRLGAWWLPSAIPDETVHPGNLDFDSLDLRAALAWTPRPWVRLGFGADWYWSPARVISTSAHTQVGAEPPGALLPSGNGTYAIFLGRLGLTVELLHGPVLKGSGDAGRAATE